MAPFDATVLVEEIRWLRLRVAELERDNAELRQRLELTRETPLTADRGKAHPSLSEAV